MGLAILQFSPDDFSIKRKDNCLNALFEAGVPIVLWTRDIQSPVIPMEDGKITSCVLCRKTLDDLKNYVYEKRRDAFNNEEDSLHIGNHLVLLWDEPELRLDEHPLRGAE